VIALAFGIGAIQHAGNPAKYGPAGGLDNYQEAVGAIGLLLLVAGSIIGGTAGTQDVETGVFRDLAATGRSRTALFLSRAAGACAISLPIAALAAGAIGAASIALAGDLAAPGAGALASGTAELLAATAFSTIVAVGVSVLVGSRGPVIGILLGFYLAAQPLLVAIGFLGGVRQAIPSVALDRIGDVPDASIHPAMGVAILTLVAWSVVALGAGAWRTRTHEI
jgi:hypothetical protein